MVMKVFIEDIKGYVEVFNNIWKITIKKINGKNTLILKGNPASDEINISLSKIKLAYALDNVNLEEYFRYEK